MKALLVHFGIPFPNTHNIRILIDLLPQDIAQPIALERSAGITDYAVMSRYPGNFEPVEEMNTSRPCNWLKMWCNGQRRYLPDPVESPKKNGDPNGI